MTDTRKPTIEVPVRVTTEHVARPTQPPVDLPTPSARLDDHARLVHHGHALTIKPAPAKRQDSVHPAKKVMPEEQRRKIMWTTVAAAMVVVFTGWGLLWRHEFSSTGENALFSDIKNAIQKFSANNQPPPATTNQEVQDLTKEIFPQFEATN